MVSTTVCEDAETKDALLAEIVGGGGEGLILRRAASPFVAGRTRDLLKVKLWHNAEARVLRYNRPHNGKHSLRCANLVGHREFDLTWNRHEPPPPNGSIVTYRHARGDLGAGPRHPVFMRVRPANIQHIMRSF